MGAELELYFLRDGQRVEVERRALDSGSTVLVGGLKDEHGEVEPVMYRFQVTGDHTTVSKALNFRREWDAQSLVAEIGSGQTHRLEMMILTGTPVTVEITHH